MISASLLVLTLVAATPDGVQPVSKMLVRCEEGSAAEAQRPSLDPEALEAALTGAGPAPGGWWVASLPGQLAPAEPCWLALRMAPSVSPVFVWLGPVQGAFTAWIDGAQVWLRGRERDPYWRSDQGFAGFAIPAPLLTEQAPRVLILKGVNPTGALRMQPLSLMDPSQVPQHAFADGGAMDGVKDATSVLLWAVALTALAAWGVSRNRAFFFFGFATAGFALLITGMSIQWAGFDHNLIARTSATSLLMSMPFYALFFQRLYGLHLHRAFPRVAVGQVVVVGIISFVISPAGIGPLALAAIPVFLAWFGYGIYLNVRAFKAGDPIARTVAWGYGILFLFVVVDAWRYVANRELNSPVFPIGLFAFVASILAAVGLRFHRLSQQSQRMLEQMRAAAGSLSGIVTSLQSASTQLSTATAEQVTALTETATTTTEMNQTSALSAARCGELIAQGEAAAQVVAEGRDVADTGRGAIEAVAGALASVSSASRELSERTQRVDRIIDTVSFLADQSAALAINASIEASRAGEAGQGFAAVAREVRALANDSRRATAEVREVLAEIRSRTLEVEGQVTQGSATVHAGVQHVSRLAQVVTSLGGTIHDAVGLMRQVESSARQHQAGVEQVLQAVTNIQRASESIRDGAESLSTLSTEARKLSSGLIPSR